MDDFIVPAMVFYDIDEFFLENPGEEKDAEIIQGVYLVQKLIRILYDLGSESERQMLMYSTFFGLIKDTKEHGNTSVSMGVASLFFEDASHKQHLLEIGGFGAGGMKPSMFHVNQKGHVSCLMDDMKGTDAMPNPNLLKIGTFCPSQKLSTMMEEKAKLDKCVQLLKKKEDSLGYDDLTTFKVAYITGPLREHYEKKKFINSDECLEIDAAFTNSFFNEYKFLPLRNSNSYFMSQKNESLMELKAVQSMYSNLFDDNLITNKNVVLSMGLGRSSFQCGDVMAYFGMSDKNVVNNVTRLLTFEDLTYLYETLTNACDNPIIALKSGCLLYFQKNQAFRNYIYDKTKSFKLWYARFLWQQFFHLLLVLEVYLQ